MSETISQHAWPSSRHFEAVESLARRADLQVADRESISGSCSVESAAEWLELEAEPVAVPYGQVEEFVWRAAPAVVRLPPTAGQETGIVLLIASNRERVTLLSPNLELVRCSTAELVSLLRGSVEAPHEQALQQLLTDAGLATQTRPTYQPGSAAEDPSLARRASVRDRAARQALLDGLLAQETVEAGWLLRSAGETPVASQVREARLPWLLGGVVLTHAVEFALFSAAWGLMGWMALQGRIEPGWLLAWALLLLSVLPFRLLMTYLSGRLSIQAGTLLKRRLLFGALRLDPDELSAKGAGQLLGSVIESEVVEHTALAGGFLSLTALVELLLAAVVLASGAGGAWHVVVLVAWIAVGAWLARSLIRRRSAWTTQRLDLTHNLVEHLVGHRTRLAQQPREQWNAGEDEALDKYLSASQRLDQVTMTLQVLVPRGWLLIGLLGLAPAFVRGGASSTGLAIGVGGVLMAYKAFRSLTGGWEQLAAAFIAWREVQPFWQAANRVEPIGRPESIPHAPREDSRAIAAADLERDPNAESGETVRPLPTMFDGHSTSTPDSARHAERDGYVLAAHDLIYRYPGRAEPVLCGVDLMIRQGDRILLQGSSGGGKSTLAALLAASRVPDSGLLLLRGLDRATLGAANWRRRVVMAPQFHHNHVLIGTLAFNLLMGRAWPPSAEDVAEAERLCRALELGPLLDRMPAGLFQMVGETGWQLSHGERSRMFMARALLQKADVILLDESFAALDPATLQRTLELVLHEASTLLVIAHP